MFYNGLVKIWYGHNPSDLMLLLQQKVPLFQGLISVSLYGTQPFVLSLRSTIALHPLGLAGKHDKWVVGAYICHRMLRATSPWQSKALLALRSIFQSTNMASGPVKMFKCSRYTVYWKVALNSRTLPTWGKGKSQLDTCICALCLRMHHVQAVLASPVNTITALPKESLAQAITPSEPNRWRPNGAVSCPDRLPQLSKDLHDKLKSSACPGLRFLRETTTSNYKGGGKCSAQHLLPVYLKWLGEASHGSHHFLQKPHTTPTRVQEWRLMFIVIASHWPGKHWLADKMQLLCACPWPLLKQRYLWSQARMEIFRGKPDHSHQCCCDHLECYSIMRKVPLWKQIVPVWGVLHSLWLNCFPLFGPTDLIITTGTVG